MPVGVSFLLRALVNQLAPGGAGAVPKQLVLTPEGNALRERLLELLVQDSPLAGLTTQQQRALQDLLEQALSR
ncbi:hypothetical protein [Nonomuraea sp. B5E05]|uniref:hypothetical protein n=1 Tax=Nonomuraea sp. B5E05 TaxID=3153569 RepID=UPI0032615F19